MIMMHPGLIRHRPGFKSFADTFTQSFCMPVILSLVYTEFSLSTCGAWISHKSNLYYMLLPYLSIKKKIPFRYFPRGDDRPDKSDVQSLQVGLCLTCENPFKWVGLGRPLYLNRFKWHRGQVILFCGPLWHTKKLN